MFKKLTPNLMVKNVRASVLFYTGTLGFTLNMVVPKGSRIIGDRLENGIEYAYAMVSRDEVFIMLMEKAAFEADLPILKGVYIGASASFYCDVSDIDELYDAIKDKAAIDKDLHTTWYGMKEFYIRDPDGYVLCFAQKA